MCIANKKCIANLSNWSDLIWKMKTTKKKMKTILLPPKVMKLVREVQQNLIVLELQPWGGHNGFIISLQPFSLTNILTSCDVRMVVTLTHFIVFIVQRMKELVENFEKIQSEHEEALADLEKDTRLKRDQLKAARVRTSLFFKAELLQLFSNIVY